MSLKKDKLFRDSVHGYISIPANVCADFIDTPIFQRLRYIEQTSMRVLYPSAHHDRFIHSLGVYHLGKKAFAHLRTSTQRRRDITDELGISPEQWDRYKQTFHLACLLHDCGHAPFSHTLENQYAKAGSLDGELSRLANCDDFTNDLVSCSAAAHEKTSAILVLSEFRDKLAGDEHNCDPCLVARMILGCMHHTYTRPASTLTNEEGFDNCLIQLLNGETIDVDKLDYILRDTWASGVDNASIDVERLLGALILTRIGPDFPRLAFGSQALSVLQSAVDARNYLYQWIYCHHKVIYDAEMIRQSVKALGRILADSEERAESEYNNEGSESEDAEKRAEEFIRDLFSTESFRNHKDVGGIRWYLPTDGDVACLLKRHSEEIPEAREWLYRQHSRVPLWKTFAEYQVIFENKSEEDRKTILTESDKILSAFCDSHDAPPDTFLCLKAPIKKVAIEKNQLFVEVRGKPIRYSDIFEEKRENPLTYFLMFGRGDWLTPERKQKFLDFLICQQ
jgi:uncharacterized protein